MLDRRIQYRRNSSYRTRGNNFRPVKTPGEFSLHFYTQITVLFTFNFIQLCLSSLIFNLGGRLVLHLIKKHTKGTAMQGVKVARPDDFRRMTSTKRTVSRAYGGILTGT